MDVRILRVSGRTYSKTLLACSEVMEHVRLNPYAKVVICSWRGLPLHPLMDHTLGLLRREYPKASIEVEALKNPTLRLESRRSSIP